ncbi:MAG: 2-amino-4-hydroxy-6-hydroxymethyldihydropteridine diphosphokinase [Chloroflexi bacterium]|nr:2-amino-4-hydroxy-6-hydroxymethyldihydropteridine diphosphokinase [Chloroflexota bacterium]
MSINGPGILLALGSNLGDRKQNLARARKELEKKVTVIQTSSVYETPPWGILEQPAFLNQVVEIQSNLDPGMLLRFLKEIESGVGRTKTIRYGPRVIDIDILTYNDLLLDTPDLVIPHPRMFERAFVLVPLFEIQPDLTIPGSDYNVREILKTMDTTGIKRTEL